MPRKQNKNGNKQKTNKKKVLNRVKVVATDQGTSFQRVPRGVTTNPVSYNGPKWATTGCDIRIRRRELVGSLQSGNSLAPRVSVFPMSMGMSSTFPWLSQIARCFEYGTIQRLCFDITPTCPTTWSGIVQAGGDYDAGDSSPSGYSEMGTWEGTVQGPIYSPIHWEAKPEHLKMFRNRLVEQSNSGIMNDPRLNSCGNFYVIAETSTSGQTFGMMYVTYDVVLKSPQLGGPQQGVISVVTTSSGTSSYLPLPQSTSSSITGTFTEIASTVLNDTGGIDLVFNRPWKGQVTVQEPATSAGGALINANMGSSSGSNPKGWRDVNNPGVITASQENNWIVDIKAPGDYIRMILTTGVNWAANVVTTILFAEVAANFDPLSCKFGAMPGTNAYIAL